MARVREAWDESALTGAACLEIRVGPITFTGRRSLSLQSLAAGTTTSASPLPTQPIMNHLKPNYSNSKVEDLPVRIARLTPLNAPIRYRNKFWDQCPRCSKTFDVPWPAIKHWADTHWDIGFIKRVDLESIGMSQSSEYQFDELWDTSLRARHKRKNDFLNRLKDPRTGCGLIYSSLGTYEQNPSGQLEFWLSKCFCETLASAVLSFTGHGLDPEHKIDRKHGVYWAAASAVHGIVLPLGTGTETPRENCVAVSAALT